MPEGSTASHQKDVTVVTSIEAAGHSADDATQITRTPDQDSGGAELVPGQRIKDRFVIERILGRGGMGVVYRALDLRKQEAQDADPYVALKALSGDFQRDDRMVVALQREARKSQSLAHPNIATVFDFDRDGQLVYLTMEELSGQPLDELLADNPSGLPVKQARSLIRGLCRGLAYAHSKDIIHSDFKPGNVFADEDNAKILDFGIAREAKDSANDAAKFDAAELGALTPAYAALEMFQSAHPHPADDIYALAITAYELFTGKHPFDGQPAPVAQKNNLKPAPIPGIKRREWRAIRQGLAFRRNDRLPNANQFLRAFQSRKRAGYAAGATLLLSATLAGYVAFDQSQERARALPDVPFEELPAATRNEINDALQNVEMLVRGMDHQNALTELKGAYVAHPRNPRVMEKMLSVWGDLASRAEQQGNPASAQGLLDHLATTQNIDRFLTTHEELVEIRQRLEDIANAP